MLFRSKDIYYYSALESEDMKQYLLAADVTASDMYVSDATTGGDLPSWVTASLDDYEEDGSQYALLTMEIGALPADVEGRVAKVLVEGNFAKKEFIINQGVTGVSVTKTSPVTVKTIGNNFEITYPSNINTVSVYSTSGQLIKTVALEGGKSTIDASNLSRGVYILKFNDNVTIKVVK